MERVLWVQPGLSIPEAELEETASRARGPGGQNVQKTSTRVTLRWCVARSRALGERERARLTTRLAHRLTARGELVIHADETRSQARNRSLARARLAALVRTALAVRRPRRPTRPGAAAAARRLEAKRVRGVAKRGRGRVRPESDER
jgi:ribosome-associated protein